MMENKKIEIPSKCPSCTKELELVNGQLFCRNAECPARTSKALVHFTSVLKIKGVGPKSLDKLGFTSPIELYNTPIEYFIEILGEKVAFKIYKEIVESKKADLRIVLQALGINRIGETASRKISQVVSHISEINEETCTAAGLGRVDTGILVTWLNNNKELLDSLPFTFNSINTQKPLGKTKGCVCITGHLRNFNNRNDAKKYLENLGYTITDTVSAKTTALICEEDKESTKTTQAKARNIPILTIESLIKRDNINDNKI